jgi:circadian clock protein KaiB
VKPKRISTETAAFDRAVESGTIPDHYILFLFVTGTTARSVRAIQNIRAICEEKLQGRYELQVVDIYQHPEQARPEQVIVTPTLVKKLPAPVRRLIGDLSNVDRVLAGLDIVPRETAKPKKGGDAL